MRIDIARNQLSRLLAQVSKVVEARNTIPVLSCVLLESSGGKLTATGSDLDIEITGSIEVEGDDWSGCVSANLLKGIVDKLSGDTVTIEPGATEIVVKAGRSRFKLAVQTAADFPRLAANDMPEPFELDLASIVAPCLFAMSEEETRFYLCGVFLEAGKATATDGHRLAHVERGAWGEHPNVILPRKLVGMLPKGALRVSVTENKVRVENDDVTITSKLIDGTYPDYRRVIPAQAANAIRVDNAALRAAVERVALVASARGHGVRLSIAGDTIELHLRGSDGEAEDGVPCGYSGEPVEVGFNSKYLADLLANMPAGEAVFYIADGGSPMRVESAADDGCCFVLMPMRV
ncbi:DNA polymerase III subunit beta [Nitratireductor kimnyeongensis]|uniref:Beta sliding clamp n=1 Tax=Nitratireductor kimnyeongensis TaxID=430679 RepID=A0ABW0T516_9HYPH|nr:DNA polymerase III subunit beta [Nitratireductor kimnyeongensis]QZZ34547.1 DNA polymerase III subunit beta [Nitratireductor kimnyeongensis]